MGGWFSFFNSQPLHINNHNVNKPKSKYYKVSSYLPMPNEENISNFNPFIVKHYHPNNRKHNLDKFNDIDLNNEPIHANLHNKNHNKKRNSESLGKEKIKNTFNFFKNSSKRNSIRNKVSSLVRSMTRKKLRH